MIYLRNKTGAQKFQTPAQVGQKHDAIPILRNKYYEIKWVCVFKPEHRANIAEYSFFLVSEGQNNKE